MLQWMSGEILTGAISHFRVWDTSWELLKITPVGWPTGTILHGENFVFHSNRNDFPKVTFTLDGI
jgi:hypothetical protein